MVVAAVVLLGGLLPRVPVSHVLAAPPIECERDLGDTGRPPDECPPRSPIAPDGTANPAALAPGFSESIALNGLVAPTAVELAADGRVFVAEKSGVLKVFDSLADTTPTSYGGLQTNTLDLWDRGLLGMTIDPSLKDPSLPLRPWVYVLYTYDHILGSAASPPRWGDACPTPPGPTTDGCVASARVSRLSVSGSAISGPETVLIEDWCQQFTSHSVGALEFGSDGALYVSGGDAADFNREDWGQWGGTQGNPPVVPRNPCGDPPNDAMNPPTAEGGALRSQDLRTDPTAGGTSYVNAVLADNPLAYWRLGETTGTLADDAIGSANGTYTGGITLGQPGALTGDSDKAVALNGSNGYVRVPQQVLPTSITWEAWAKPTAYPGDTALVGQWNGTSGSMLYVTSDAGGRVYLWVNGSFISAAAPAPGSWHHFAGTYNGTTAAIYIDGGLAAGPSPLAGPLTSAPRFLEMGTYNNAGGGKLNGAIDEVALYPTALSGARIQAHYAAGRQPVDPTTLDGTILRVDPVTGAAFAGNPYAASADPNKRRIIAYGLRNPFRIAPRPGTNEVWLGDVGWMTWEEINRVASTSDATVENFGWPCYEGTGRQAGYDAANLTICEGLYAEGGSAVTAPAYTYNHNASVVTGDGCAITAGSAISAMVFYPETGGTFPAEYHGGLFFGDHARNCIWWIPKGSNGQPDLAQRATFVSPAAHPVDLEVGPDGALYYVDINDGQVRRVQYTATNLPPTAVADASPTSGPLPLTVSFDGTDSTDPEGGALAYAWDLDGDGAYDDSTSATPSWTYTTAANVTVRLSVTDIGSLTGTDSILIGAGNSPPVPVITTPSASTTWAVGEQIAFAGSASDADDGSIPAAGLSWNLTIQHCPGGSCHPHAIQDFPGVESGSFTAPEHGYPSFLDLTLTATDSIGATASTTVRLDPRSVTLSFATVPTGLQVSVNGEVSVAPFTRTVIEGSTNSVTAVSPQALGGTNYVFQSWQSGAAVNHNVVASTDQSDTATYVESATTSYVDTVLADNPLAYWRLGETSGTLADDAVGSANGTYTGGFTLNQPGALTGDSNGAVALNGTTGYVRVPQQSLAGSITWEAWARPTSFVGDTALVGQWNGSSGSMLYLTSDFGGRVYLWINGSSIFAPAPAPGSWHHFVGTYTGTAARLYIDGVLVAGPTTIAGPLTSAPRFLEIGTYNNAGGGKLNGRVDEVAVYTTALSAARIQAHFAAASGGSPPNQPPIAVAQATPKSGPVPLTINFDGSGSSDPEGGALAFAWDLDGDGVFDDSTSATPSWTYTSAGQVTARLRVTDPAQQADTDNVVITASNPGGMTYVDTVLADNPLAYWRLGETTGTLADDAVGSANGTYTGAFTLNQTGALTGDSNGSVALNGTSAYVRVPQQALTGSITWEAWARPNSYPGDTALVGQWNGASGSMLYLTSDSGGRVYLWINGSSISAAAPATGSWHHFAGTYDGSTARLYIDGVLAAGPTALAGPLTSAPRFLEIGTYNNAGGGKLNGRVDEVAVYTTALSAARIQAHFAAASAP